MSFQVVDFDHDHMDGAAVLLAERCRRERQYEPEFPARFDDVAEARAWVRENLEQANADGVVAVQGGRVIGFLLGRVELPAPRGVRSLADSPRAGHIINHAVAPEEGGEIYRHMYAAYAPIWLQRGVFDHNLGIAASDAEALDAWYSLGFGRRSAHAMRDTSPLAVHTEDLRIRRATNGDVRVVFELIRGIFRHLSGPPSFEPYLVEAEPAIHEQAELWLASADTVIWLAEREGTPVGVTAFWRNMPRKVAPERSLWLTDAFVDPQERGRGTGLALLAAGLDAARSEGYDWCLLNFLTTNLPAARFWTRTAGFRPITYFLCRRIDERIAWARPPAQV